MDTKELKEIRESEENRLHPLAYRLEMAKIKLKEAMEAPTMADYLVKRKVALMWNVNEEDI